VDEQAVATRVSRLAWIRLGHPIDGAGARGDPGSIMTGHTHAGLATRLNNEYAATAVVVDLASVSDRGPSRAVSRARRRLLLLQPAVRQRRTRADIVVVPTRSAP
jgi:hypothetical protein